MVLGCLILWLQEQLGKYGELVVDHDTSLMRPWRPDLSTLEGILFGGEIGMQQDYIVTNNAVV